MTLHSCFQPASLTPHTASTVIMRVRDDSPTVIMTVRDDSPTVIMTGGESSTTSTTSDEAVKTTILPRTGWPKIYYIFRYLFHPRVTAVARKNPGHSAKSAGGRLQLNTYTPYVCGFAWSDMVYGCMVYTELAARRLQFHVAPAMPALEVHHFGIF